MTAILEYSDRQHRYFADGREILSVTQILNKAGLVSQYCMDEEARWRGSEVHRLCAIDDDSTGIDLRTVDKRLRGYIRAWRQYRSDSGFIPTSIEHRIDDHVNGYSGRLDRVGFRPTLDPLYFQDAIVDLKTSKSGSVADYVRYQLVAYVHALRPKHYFERIAVALKPDGTYRCKVYSQQDFQTDLARWLQILRTVKESLNANN